jgi:GDP/UDP-N,N'-diacetylbacillosamine 2-epimerase (hydrolysing)
MKNIQKKKVCIVTGSRADYGLLKFIIKQISNEPKIQLQILATGTHLSKRYGMTVNEIKEDGFVINNTIDILDDSTLLTNIPKLIARGLTSFSDCLKKLKPDVLVVLGDRFEIFSVTISASFLKIPILHIHGGEKTVGSYDDSMRHCITKMSHVHCVATAEYKKRVIQLGEEPRLVFNVGGLGVDCIKNTKLLNKIQLEDSLGIRLSKKNLLITFHPPTLEKTSSLVQINQLLKAVSKLNDTKLLFTSPALDAGSNSIVNAIEKFVSNNKNAYFFKSLGQQKYFSCINQFDGVIGNSSSGILEVPSLKKGTINIGSRQEGRTQCKSIINCLPNEASISTAIKKLYSTSFQNSLKAVKSPYGNGGAAEKIISIIKKTDFNKISNKSFHDLKR